MPSAERTATASLVPLDRTSEALPLRRRRASSALATGSRSLLAALAMGVLSAWPQSPVARAAEAFPSHRDAVLRQPQLVRYYTFDQTTAANPVAASLGAESEPLTYAGKKPLTLTAGSLPGSQAVQLDEAPLQAKPLAVTDAGFTVEIRFRKHGQGVELGNGNTNGMIFAQGDGYWTGMRVWTTYPDRRLRFELGRPKPASAFGLTAADPVPDGVWHHLAASWDGREMRLYLNGVLLQAAAYAGPYSPPAGPLKIGYANAGVGSLRMDVEEVAVYRQALPPAEILQHAFREPRIPATVQQALEAGTAAMAAGDGTAAAEAFRRMSDLPDAEPAHRAVARTALARTLRARNQLPAAIAQYAAVFDDAQAPPPLREIAARMCLPDERALPEPLVSKSVYQHLLKLPEFSPAEQLRIRLCLAERLLRDRDPAAARQQYEDCLRAADLANRDRWELRLQIAHSYLNEKDFAAARSAYTAIAGDESAPPEYRGQAALCFADTYGREKAYGAAAAVYAKLQERTELPRHFRQEAAECLGEMKRLEQGLPARDPLATRTHVPTAPQPAVTFHVAPDGRDDAAGTAENPFASLFRARDAIRQLKAKRSLPAGGVAVLVHGGLYRVQKTFDLTADDGGTPAAPIVYRAAPGETPVFSGGVRLSGFQPVSDPAVRDRFDPAIRERVVQVELKKSGVTDFGALTLRGYGKADYPTNPWVDVYLDGEALPLARWPNSGSLAIGKVHQGRTQEGGRGKPGEFEYDGDRPKRWVRTEDVWMFGAWEHLWAGSYLKVARLDPEARRVTTAQGSSYGFRPGNPFCFLNVLEELDQPGEWYLDRASGLLYLLPPKDLSQARVDFPLLSAPFVAAQEVRHVILRGLIFEAGRTEGAVISGGEQVLLAGCTFRQLGGNGVVLRGGVGHGVLGCDIRAVGAGGVRVAGGDRKTLTPGKHFVENCHISDFSRVDRVYAPAVHVDGVGQRITHNLFHDSPHHGMRVEGYEHTIEFNEVHSVVYEFDDQAGIDIYGNPAYRGLVIRHNFWHHIGSGYNVAGQAGIRLDDFISDVLICGNVFYRCAGGHFGGVQIHGGKDNIVDNNLFIDCKSAISFSPWGQARWLARLAADGTKSAVSRGGVDITQSPHSERYPDLARMKENADRNFLWRNVAVDCGEFTARDRGVNERMDNHAFRGEAGFADPAGRDFTLSDASPVYARFPFRRIPFREIGLYQDEYRATWPVRHEVTQRYMRE